MIRSGGHADVIGIRSSAKTIFLTRSGLSRINPLARVIGAPAECDLCNVVREKWLELTTVIEILALQRIYREECHLTLTLQAKAQQSNSKPLRIELHWDGHWADGVHEMRAHMAKTVP